MAGFLTIRYIAKGIIDEEKSLTRCTERERKMMGEGQTGWHECGLQDKKDRVQVEGKVVQYFSYLDGPSNSHFEL